MKLKQQIKLSSIIAILILSLSACSWLKQPPAPVESTYPDANAPNGGPGSSQSGGYNTTPSSSSDYPPPTQYPSSSGGGYTPSTASVDPNATYHVVVSGDTLFNISKRYGVSQSNILAWNNMSDNTVKLGQKLRVKASSGSTTTTTTGNTTTTPTSTTPSPTTTVSGINWVKPTQGSIVTRFTNANKGVDISGSMGQPVVAAAAGKVVYSGSGLKGYGNLVIIQHNQTYLSAYAHNKIIVVKEGQAVKQGQKIAEMGNSDADRVKLHFEIRKQGQPVDPTQFVKL